MADPFLGEIRIFAGGFAPTGWAFCNGDLLSIQQNSALFAVIGTSYGGNGTTTFGLPNLQGSLPLGAGNGTGLSDRVLGAVGGESTVALTQEEIPEHDHVVQTGSGGFTSSPSSYASFGPSGSGRLAYASPVSLVAMNAAAVATFGNNLPHNNLSPYLALSFIIALQGIYPSQS